MIGKKVTYEVESTDPNGEKKIEEKEGTVKSVLFEKGSVLLEMQDGSKITSLQVVKITDRSE